MKFIIAVVASFCLLAAVVSASAQGGAPASAKEPDKAQVAGPDLGPLMEAAGLDEHEKAVFQLLVRATDMDPIEALLMMMVADQGGGGTNDVTGLMLLAQMLRSTSARQPTALMADKDLLVVVEDGVVYRISLLDGSVKTIPYRQPKQAAALPAEVAPVLKAARERALQATCVSNMKSLCLAALLYAQDHDETLPTEAWPQQLEPYAKTRAIYRCPAAAGQDTGYAINDKLVGLNLGKIATPAETVLFFESDHAGDTPFGGVDALVEKPRHAGFTVVGFADGHVQAVPVEKARKLLARDVK